MTGPATTGRSGPDVKRTAIRAQVAALAANGVAYVSAFLPGGTPAWAPWLFALGTATILVATMVLGAARNGRIGRGLARAFALILAVLVLGFGLLLGLPDVNAADPTLILGLPPRAAVLLYGIGILPFFVVPVAYAVTFDELTLSERDLERVRAAGREARARAAVPADDADADAVAATAGGGSGATRPATEGGGP